ncbi:MAG: hypothetical protein ACQEP0_05090 [Natrinema limicola]
MSISHEKSDIWSVVLGALQRGGGTDEDAANALGVSIDEVRQTLEEMNKMDWVEWPDDDDGTFRPGDKAEEYLRLPDDENNHSDE